MATPVRESSFVLALALALALALGRALALVWELALVLALEMKLMLTSLIALVPGLVVGHNDWMALEVPLKAYEELKASCW